MTTYNIVLSQFFPSWHLRKGEPTNFKELLRIVKLHTIRANYSLWKKRFEKIARGEAILIIRVWLGRPYRSKTMELARLDKDSGIGIQQLTFGKGLFGLYSMELPYVDGNLVRVEQLAQNDGLDYEDWCTWFSNYDHSQPLAVIHFTHFRY